MPCCLPGVFVFAGAHSPRGFCCLAAGAPAGTVHWFISCGGGSVAAPGPALARLAAGACKPRRRLLAETRGACIDAARRGAVPASTRSHRTLTRRHPLRMAPTLLGRLARLPRPPRWPLFRSTSDTTPAGSMSSRRARQRRRPRSPALARERPLRLHARLLLCFVPPAPLAQINVRPTGCL